MRYLIAVIILFCSGSLLAKEYKMDTITISSKILNENRLILIFRPADLAMNDFVTSVYLLDGESAQYRYEKVINSEYNNPIVGIGIVNTDRRRDLLVAKDATKFLNFIENELKPEIEKRFTSNKNILFGHSLAGAFTLYSMLTKPGLFDKYIASSLTPIMNLTNISHYLELDKKLTKTSRFYFSYGSNDLKQVKKYAEILFNNLTGVKFNKLLWGHEILEGMNHNNSDTLALINGIISKD
jgi:predicted alpha/beta superfamily hydrolase